MARRLHWVQRLRLKMMNIETKSNPHNPERNMADRNKAVRILAKSIFRELTAQGYDQRQIVNLATELISEVTTDIASKSPPAQD
jgi:hypothetical protein